MGSVHFLCKLETSLKKEYLLTNPDFDKGEEVAFFI